VGDKLPQSTPVLVRRLKRVAANCLKASRAATTEADTISWNARANTCWQCVARLEEHESSMPQTFTAPTGELDAQLLPVYFGLVAALAEVLGPATYKVEARHLPAWARARLSELMKR